MLSYRKINMVKKRPFFINKRECFLNKRGRFYLETISITSGVYENRSMVTHASLYET